VANVVRCAVCGYENYEGEDNCDNCGADLRTVDVPQEALSFQGRLLGERLEDLGATSPITMDAAEPVNEAIERMRADGIDHVIAVDGERVVGIFTERDAVLKLGGRHLASVTVGDVMTHDPVVLRETDTVAIAIHKMAVGGFRHIPIVDGTGATGVVTARDVFRHILTITG
jgi:CBS domain-containing protein